VRTLVRAAAPRLGADGCRVGFAAPWTGDEALFPPLWAAYFLPACDVVPLDDLAADGPELRILMGEPAATAAGVELVAALPGGGLYRKRR
jgi:hypothetical protein